MKLGYANLTTNEQQIVTDPFYKQLVTYLLEQETPPTLRQLKEAFPASKLEKKLERCIRAQLIIRENRRYFTTITYDAVQSNQTTVDDWVAKLMAKPIKPAQLYTLAKDFQQQKWIGFLPETLDFCYPATLETSQLGMDAYSTQQMANTLPHYFQAIGQQESRFYPKLTQTIGDVDPEYFLDQVQVILEKVARQRKIRPSIFLTALHETNLITPEVPYEVKAYQTDHTYVQLENTYHALPPIVKGQIIASILKKTQMDPFIVIDIKPEQQKR